jgi:hypothetical protein
MDEQTVSPETAKPQPGEPPKKPYTTPQVVVHGTVAELTASKLAGTRLLAPGYLTEA